MKKLVTFDEFINEAKTQQYYIDVEYDNHNHGFPGGNEKDLKDDYGFDVEDLSRTARRYYGTEKNLQDFLDDYGLMPWKGYYEINKA